MEAVPRLRDRGADPRDRRQRRLRAAVGVVALALAFVVGTVALLASEALLVVVAILLGVAFVLAVVVAGLLIQVPIRTYLRYYALFVLGDTDAAFDPIPELGAAVRSDVTAAI